MPIMAVNELTDARGAALQLARTAQSYISRESQPYDAKVAMNNVFRLIQAYRTHGFFGFSSYPAPENVPGSLSQVRFPERHVQEVKKALDGALTDAFREVPREQALDTIESVLRAIAYPERGEQSEEAMDRTLAFFKAFIERLPSY